LDNLIFRLRQKPLQVFLRKIAQCRDRPHLGNPLVDFRPIPNLTHSLSAFVRIVPLPLL
jgi:hypothetical protein